MYLVLSGQKSKKLQARIFNPIIHHISDDDDDDDDDYLNWQGKAKQFISATNNATHKFPASREGKIESWGVLSLLGGLCNIVSLEVKEMVWGKRRLLDCCLCSVLLKMEGEERRGKERRGKERKGKERKGEERKGKERHASRQAGRQASRQASVKICISGV